MKCKKCRKTIPDDAKFCCYCGAPIQKKMYRRPDGLYEKIVTIDGKRIAFRGKTEKEVERKMVEFQGVKERGPLFKDVAEDWEREHFPTLTYNSKKSYKPAKRRAVTFFGERPIKEIEVKDGKAYLGQLPQTWAQKTLKNHLLVLNLIFEYAAGNGILDHNPMEYVQIPKGAKRSYRRAPTPEEIETIKNSIDKPFGLFAYFLLYTGCRRGEALALQYKDVDRKNKTIHITKSVYHEGNAPRIKAPKTEKGIRDIILLDVLAEKLPKGKASDFIFGSGGSPLTSSKVEDLWMGYQKATGLDGVTPHVVRHGYASILHEAGVDPKDAQEMLGHANISTTLDIYTHITEKKRSETAEKLNRYTQNTQCDDKSPL
ncbi:hypothetical protein DWV16_16680 [Anaerotruncus sp. AF02-27]|uniref:tyrosine-type recombinase/integrase n=1 Tax=Anaerotruncus TaxID=244127 RepID=UPI000E4DE025|nr:tyrosine-type recombinase/integrase [Anaerotruncus sp. AF02-27]RGX53598.1 hypothetical protein DWV16_16680 [Anaerotruncus sp. AF02-27]